MDESKYNNKTRNSIYLLNSFKGQVIDLGAIQLSYEYADLIETYNRNFPKSRRSKSTKKDQISSLNNLSELDEEFENIENISKPKQRSENFMEELSISKQNFIPLKDMNLYNDKPNNPKNYHLKNLLIVEKNSFKKDVSNNSNKKNFDDIEYEDEIFFMQHMDSNCDSYENLDEISDFKDFNDLRRYNYFVFKSKNRDILKEKNYISKYYSLSDLRILWRCSEIVLITKLNRPTIDKQGRLKVSMKEKPQVIKGEDSFLDSMNELIWSNGGKKIFRHLVKILDTVLIFCQVSQNEFPFYLNVLGFDILYMSQYLELANLISDDK